MKTRQFKTKTNNGHTVHIRVRLFSKEKNLEPAVLFDTVRIVPIQDREDYEEINRHIPTFYIIRKTERYIVYFTRSTSFKLSTFKKINQLVDEML